MARFVWRLFRHQLWAIGVVNAPIEAFLDPSFEPVIDWFSLPDRPVFRADPFLLQREERRYVLFEEYDYRTGLGSIASAEWLDDGRLSNSRPAITAQHHLSYPFVLTHAGRSFCTPEAHQSYEVPLFETDGRQRGCNRWIRRAPLVEGLALVDPTLLRHDGRWWLFTALIDSGPATDLMVFYADELLGPWQGHLRNPVKSTPSGARPAGTPFRHDGGLYRPTQDSSRTYGGRVVLQKIERLTPSELEEIPVATISPAKGSPYPKGLHTLSAAGSSTLVDGRKDVFVFAEFRRRLARLARWTSSRCGVPRMSRPRPGHRR